MDNGYKNKFDVFSNRIVGGFITTMLLFCLIAFGVVCGTYVLKHPEYLTPFELLYIVPVAVLYIIEIYLIIKSVDTKCFLLIWSVFFVIQSILIILYFNSPPQGDGGGIFKEAEYLSHGGNFPLDRSNYYFSCYWLMWTVYVEKVIIDVLGVGYGFFKIIGTVCLLGSGFILYKIVNKLASERIAKIVFGLFVLYSPISLCVSHFSHQHIAFFLLMLTIYLMWSESWYRWALAGLSCGLMNKFRPWGVLFLLTVIVYIFYRVFTKESKLRKMLLLFAIFFIIYKLIGFGVDQILTFAGYYDPQALGNTLLWRKIDRGIDPDFSSFSAYVDDYANANSITNDEYSAIENELYKNHVYNLLKTPTPYIYIVNKMIRMFGEVDCWFENCFANKKSILEYPYRFLYFLNWFQYFILIALAFIGKLRNKTNKSVNLLSVFTIGYFLAHFFIEAFSSYRLCIYPLLLVYAAYTINTFFEKNTGLQNKIGRKQTVR